MATEAYLRVRMFWLLRLRGSVGIWAQGVGCNPKHWALYLYLPKRGYSISLHGVSRI